MSRQLKMRQVLQSLLLSDDNIGLPNQYFGLGVLMVLYSLLLVIAVQDSSKLPNISSFDIGFVNIVTLLLGWSIVLAGFTDAITEYFQFPKNQIMQYLNATSKQYFESIFLTSLSVSSGMFMLECDDMLSDHCAYTILLLFLPLIVSSVLPNVSFLPICSSWIICFCITLIRESSSLIGNDSHKAIVLGIVSALSFVTAIENKKIKSSSSIRLYQTGSISRSYSSCSSPVLSSLQGSTSAMSSFKMVDGINTENMNVIIANVAHDLKTPLAAFESGFETTKDIIHGIESEVRNIHEVNSNGNDNFDQQLDALAFLLDVPSDNLRSTLASPRNVNKTQVNRSSFTTTNNTTFGEGGLKMLLVDDSITILKLSGSMLRRKGHTVTTAENDEETVQIAMDAGADGFICKPFTMESLNSKIKEFYNNNNNNNLKISY
eukprot:gene7421-10114_t